MLIAHSNPINLCSFAWPFVASHRVASRPMYIKPVPKWTWERVASESIKSNTRTILSHAHCAAAGYIHLRLHKPRRARTHVKRELSRKESCERVARERGITIDRTLLRAARRLGRASRSRNAAFAFQSVRNCVTRTTIHHESAKDR